MAGQLKWGGGVKGRAIKPFFSNLPTAIKLKGGGLSLNGPAIPYVFKFHFSSPQNLPFFAENNKKYIFFDNTCLTLSVSDPDPDPVGSVSFGQIRIHFRKR
jgi:hypothetical protein